VVVRQIRNGESQRTMSREYGISRRAIQDWLQADVLPQSRGRKPARTLQEYKDENMSSSLVTDTIREALKQEKVTGGLALHSDQGSQYTSQAYFDLTQEYPVSPSMSSPGCPYDNAAMENFFCTLKTECLYRAHFATRAAVEQISTSISAILSVFRSKTASPRLKSGTRPRKLFLIYNRAFLCLLFGGTVPRLRKPTEGLLLHQ